MSISTLHRRSAAFEQEPTVRLRCDACEVAWTGPIETPCWVCDEDGRPVNGALIRSTRERDDVDEFDLVR